VWEDDGVRAHDQRPGSRARLGAGFVALALIAVWVGHAATWYLTGGTAPSRALSGPLHAYLGPVGAVLAVVGVSASWAVWRGLDRLAALTRRVRRATTAAATAAAPSPPDSSRPAVPLVGPLRLGLSLATVQLVLYLCQENLEARLAGRAAPGLHALTAHHGAPIAIHLALALVATALAVEVLDRWQLRVTDLGRAVIRYRALVARRGVALLVPGPRPALRPPASVHGWSLLGRAPPLAAA
jgi:hypothetical protein